MTVDNPPEDIRSNPGISDDQASRDAQESLRLLGYHDLANLIDEPGDNGGADHDVLIVGAGQTGVTAAFGLRRRGVRRISVIDAAPTTAGLAWRSTARMRTLRTPKTLAGPELGVPALSFRAWYDATHGVGGFDQLGRIPTGDWADYLDWFREQVGVDVRRGVRLESIEPTDDGHIALHLLRVDGSPEEGTTRRWVETARKVVLAAGVSGTGGPLIPEVVAELSPAVFAHTADAIDFAALTGKSVAVLGAAASAFDAAATALEVGAGSVDVYTRRPELVIPDPSGPPINRLVQDAFPHLPDAERWRRRKATLTAGASVPSDSVERAALFGNYRLHVSAPWISAREDDGRVTVQAEDGTATYDFVIAGTGYQQNPESRTELASIAPLIALWRDRFTPPEGQDSEILGVVPYLGPGYELTEKDSGQAPWLANIHVFSIGANASFGLPVGDVPSLPTGVPRLVEAIIRDLVIADLDLDRARAVAAR
ncbi:FAD-dependent oxidoreductase [Gordonia amarae]|uniref:FAD-dependent oxidoreductase n=2 Tax=Gordonia amarae TaxID=36821 RepID=A0A857LLZ5_9ACTN|nr:NAD(P)/FAD-dependent oxidoreductase [Gordonia amarae]MCS3877715.1 cation diffusion facilitator CzcD-associated flavoprotein CzcO [Gordonia amarae]QHN16419.1 FAD-dependent oxidoreductase [Gordonia amarae]QHN20988.1 FAD-dependent oxidoreductase [Gordonia amarae]QHN29840.1 FAD-dependent oxidoreductase [Gordonia amarae]QHN38614.1 FAD-dependent oxidoreductase [Gordonia amarae]